MGSVRGESQTRGDVVDLYPVDTSFVDEELGGGPKPDDLHAVVGSHSPRPFLLCRETCASAQTSK